MRVNTLIFIQRAVEKHGDRYDYSITEVINSREKVKIICKTHGIFEQYMHNHVKAGAGCPSCFSASKKKSNRKVLSEPVVSTSQMKAEIINMGEAILICLSKSRYTIIDREDLEKVMKFNWSFSAGYIVTNNPEAPINRLHRYIMDLYDINKIVDHLNRNPCDNRKCNLRVCTAQQNSMNRKPKKGGSSIYKGVYFDRRCNKWLAKIALNTKPTYIGLFSDEIEAAKAYDKKAKQLFGEFAYLNFPYSEITN